MIHGFVPMRGVLSGGRQAIQEAAKFTRSMGGLRKPAVFGKLVGRARYDAFQKAWGKSIAYNA